MKKFLKWIAIAVLLVVVLPLVIVIAINAFDDKLDPKAAAYGEVRATTVPEAENGYYAVIAMGAPDGADGMEYAKTWIAEARAAAKENRPENHPPAKRAKRPALCDAAQASCLTEIRDKAAEVSAQLEIFREDFERYEKLLAFRRYEEVMDYAMRADSHMPPYVGLTEGQRAYLNRVALAVQAGNLDEALSALEREFAFQRVMLSGARTLIGKMIANALYTRDIAFVLDLLQARPAEMKPHTARLAALLQPIDMTALRMDAMFEREYAWVKQVYKDPQSGKSLGLGSVYEYVGLPLFYKKNATLNKAYDVYSAMGAASLKPASSVAAEWRKLPVVSTELTFWDYLDNPVGKILLGVAMPAFDGYVLRMHDLDAFNRLAGLRLEMLAADVGAEGAADFVARAEARFHDPYTGKPMAWDAASKRLSFKASEVTAKRKLINLDQGRIYVQL